MKSIRLTNVRCLEDTGNVPLSPVTLLVGENSSGKSTFLRTLPLLRQSMDRDVDGPILWTGKQVPERDVDFGSFRETFTRDKNSGGMTFQFQFPLKCMEGSLLDVETLPVTYSITVSPMSKPGREYVSKFSVKVGEAELTYWCESASSVPLIVLDEYSILTKEETDSLREDESEIPDIGTWNPSYRDYTTIFRVQIPLGFEALHPFMSAVMAQDTLTNPGKIIERLQMTMTMMTGESLCGGASLAEINNRIEKGNENGSLTGLTQQTLKKFVQQMLTDDTKQQGKDKCIAKYSYICSRLAEIDGYLFNYLDSIHYFGPLRATAQRFYANRNLGATDVDATGSNLPYVLLRLARESVTVKGEKKTRLSEFQAWMDAFFGFHVKVVRSGNTVSMLLEQSGKKESVNLSDTGFGYSQLLPMLVQIWDLATKRRTKSEKEKAVPLVIAIEEPELHLHPGLQARLAEILLAGLRLARENGVQMQLILETHSETIVNFFGRAIAKGKLTNDEVSIVLFERSAEITETAPAKIHLSGYNKDGYLTDWPIGFLASRG